MNLQLAPHDSGDLNIRLAEPEDTDFLHEVLSTGAGPSAQVAAVLESLQDRVDVGQRGGRLADNRYGFYLVVSQNRLPVGVAVVEVDRPPAEEDDNRGPMVDYSLYLRERQRGRGIGRRALGALSEMMGGVLGNRRERLLIEANNHAARAVAEALHFCSFGAATDQYGRVMYIRRVP